jgi:hypothetical protein
MLSQKRLRSIFSRTVILLIYPLLIASFFSLFSISNDEAIVNSILSEISKKQQKEHCLIISGTGAAMPDQVEALIFSYDSNLNLNRDQARDFYIKCSEQCLAIINSHKEIIPYAKNFPFNENNLRFSIAFYDNKGKATEYPHVAYISLINGYIFYSYHDNKLDKFVPEHKYKESYKEALKKVHEKS